MLEDYWYIVAFENEVARQPKAVTLFDKSIVVYQGRNKEYYALEDRCAHRNAPLSAGKVCENNIECPYHGWLYSGDGSLNSIPSLNKCDNPSIRIESYHCINQDGYVWVCIGEKPKQEKPISFPFLQEKGWTSFSLSTEFNAPVEQCIENFLDCPHAVHVHKSWFRFPVKSTVLTKLRVLEDGVEVEYFNEPRKKSAVWGLLQNSTSSMKHTDRFMAPSTSRVDYIFSDSRHYTITSSCTPINDNKTHVYTRVTFKYGRIGWLIRLFFQPLAKVIITQDVDIMDKQRWNIERFRKESFYYAKCDLLIPYILEWRRALKQNKKPTNIGCESSQDIVL